MGATQNGTVPIQRGAWLDALRFSFALAIILHHYQLAAPIPLASLHPVFERGYLLTDFFLIDSGYVLGRVYAERVLSGRMSFGAFVRKRFLRVIPAHLIMSMTLIAITGGAAIAGLAPRHPEWFDWRELPSQFFLLQAYGVPGGKGWNAPSWSISALIGCYLCFPFLLRAASKATPWRTLLIAVGVFTLANLMTWKVLGLPVYQMPLKYGFLRALPLFLLGVSLARFSDGWSITPRSARRLGVAALLALIVAQTAGRYSLISLGLISTMICAAGQVPVSRPSKWVEKAALMAFSMFITNEVFRIAYFGVARAVEARLALPVGAQWLLWAGGVGSAVVFALIFYELIDRPTQAILNSGRARSAPPRPIQSSVPSATSAPAAG